MAVKLPPAMAKSPAVEESFMPAEIAEEPVKQVTARHYRANYMPIYHPYQDVLVPVSGSVLLEPDNWVEVQLGANIISEA